MYMLNMHKILHVANYYGNHNNVRRILMVKRVIKFYK